MESFRTKFDFIDTDNDFDFIALIADKLIDDLENKKYLNKEDRYTLIKAVQIVYELRKNQNCN
jgi:hypothetical protein